MFKSCKLCKSFQYIFELSFENRELLKVKSVFVQVVQVVQVVPLDFRVEISKLGGGEGEIRFCSSRASCASRSSTFLS